MAQTFKKKNYEFNKTGNSIYSVHTLHNSFPSQKTGEHRRLVLIWSSCPFGLNLHRSFAWEVFINESPGCCRKRFGLLLWRLLRQVESWCIKVQNTLRTFKWLLHDTASCREAEKISTFAHQVSRTLKIRSCNINRLIWSGSDSTRHKDTQTDDKVTFIYSGNWITKQHNLLKEVILWHLWLRFNNWTANSKPSCCVLA